MPLLQNTRTSLQLRMPHLASKGTRFLTCNHISFDDHILTTLRAIDVGSPDTCDPSFGEYEQRLSLLPQKSWPQFGRSDRYQLMPIECKRPQAGDRVLGIPQRVTINFENFYRNDCYIKIILEDERAIGVVADGKQSACSTARPLFSLHGRILMLVQYLRKEKSFYQQALWTPRSCYYCLASDAHTNFVN